jgi:hypothetical protein
VALEALECLGGVAQAAGHKGELEWAEWSGNVCLLYIVGMDGDLIVSSHQIHLGEDETTEKLVGVVMDMMDGSGRGWSGRLVLLCSRRKKSTVVLGNEV